MKTLRVGLIGAGYISTWHAESLKSVPNVELVAICDVSKSAAEAFAGKYGIKFFTSVEDLIKEGECDSVHILTPPHLHKPIAIQCLNGGLDVLVEKPVAESVADVEEIVQAAEQSGRNFYTGHNFLGLPKYQKLKSDLAKGAYGKISSAEFTWCYPFAPIRSGPFSIWALQKTENLLLELGPHPIAFAVDLFGPLEILSVDASKLVELPSGEMRPQSFRIMARAGDVDVNVTVSTVEVIDDRSFVLHGSSAHVRLVYSDDVLLVDRENSSDIVINPLRRRLGNAAQHILQGFANAAVQGASLNSKSPYARSFQGTAAAIYSGNGDSFASDKCLHVMQALEDAVQMIPEDLKTPPAPKTQDRTPNPTAMVIGGTGFIGRALIRKLVDDGQDVRVVSRGRDNPFKDVSDRVELVSVSLSDQAGLIEAMKGIDVVYNLAKYLGSTWDDCLLNDVGTTVNVAEACMAAGVDRLIYTGTIASYDMSDPSVTIDEDTAFAADMENRSLYGRSKAECERRLIEMHKERDLPVVIVRPAIVIGAGGPLQHWGIARWHGAGAARVWGNGRNILPFVLIDDVADAMAQMRTADNIIGESFNLVGEPMLSARDYFDEIHASYDARVKVTSGNLYGFYAMDVIKYGLKKFVLRKKNIAVPSLVDWKSRAHFSPFSNKKTKDVLNWKPVSSREEFVKRAIKDANIFGF